VLRQPFFLPSDKPRLAKAELFGFFTAIFAAQQFAFFDQ
jgi:hypothetical protein